MRLLMSAAFSTALTFPACAQEMLVTVEVPRLEVAEYHAPYLAMWVEGADGEATSLAVWYDVELRNEEGETWLKDLRQWWRRIGRETEMPVDGVSGPTRPPGEHKLGLDAADPQIAALSGGKYEFVIEAAREVGGREILRAPFEWPASAEQKLELKGERELGLVTVVLKP